MVDFPAAIMPVTTIRAGWLAIKGCDLVLWTIGCLPELYSVIPTARGDEPTIGRPGNGIYVVAMAAIGHQWEASLSVPDLDSMIPTAGSDVTTIGRPGQRSDFVAVAVIGEQRQFRFSIPDAHRVISISSGNEAAIGRPGNSVDYSIDYFTVFIV